MGFSLKRAFAPCALSAAMAVSGCADMGQAFSQSAVNDNVDINALVPTGNVCTSIRAVYNPRKPVEYYVAAQYRRAATTNIGQMLLNPRSDPISVCFNRDLDKESKCGFYSVGESDDDSVSLNPAKRVSNIAREIVLIHEARHVFQKGLNINFDNGKNVPERKRVVVYWLMEADARLSEILYAHEKSLQGNPAYKAYIRGEDSAPMQDAFEKSLAGNPKDMVGAMRAAIFAFLTVRNFTEHYANLTMDYVEANKKSFNPDLPTDKLYDHDNLIMMGNMGKFGNYMSDDLIQTFKMGFQQADYANLQVERQKGPTGPDCTL